MNHDPFCLVTIVSKNTASQATVVTFASGTCKCALIAEVRADERSRCIAEVKALGPLQQFQEGYFIWGRKTVDVARILRSQP